MAPCATNAGSVTWEAQALIRARPAGDVLGRDFAELADSIRYPAQFSENEVREVRRIKARVEAETPASWRRAETAPEA